MIVCRFEGQASISLPVASCLPNLKTGPAQHFFSASKFVVMFWTEFTISMRWISMCVIWLCSWWKKISTGVNRTNLVVFNFALGIVRYLKKLHLCKLCSNHLSMVYISAHSAMDSFIHMHEYTLQTILFQSVWLRSAQHSCEKCGYLVREPHDAKRNHCDATRWCDHFCCQGNRAQRCASHVCSWLERRGHSVRLSQKIRRK